MSETEDKLAETMMGRVLASVTSHADDAPKSWERLETELIDMINEASTIIHIDRKLERACTVRESVCVLVRIAEAVGV